MSADDITLLSVVLTADRRRSRLYYYQGNFYKPLALLSTEVPKVRRAIRQWMKENRERVQRDRSHPDYKNPLQIFDEQMNVASS